MMPRTRLLAIAVVTAAGAIGCAHCDTCDDFPAPCIGGTCNGVTPGYAVATPTMATGPVETQAAPYGAPAPGSAAAPATPDIPSGPGPLTTPAPATAPEPSMPSPTPPAPAAPSPTDLAPITPPNP